jgi:hypothetical protein
MASCDNLSAISSSPMARPDASCWIGLHRQEEIETRQRSPDKLCQKAVHVCVGLHAFSKPLFDDIVRQKLSKTAITVSPV